MVQFANEPVPQAVLPQFSDTHFEQVDRNLLRISLGALGLFGAAVAIGSIVISILVTSRSWIPLAVGAGVLGLTAIAAGLRTLDIRHMGYQIRSHDLTYRRGFISQTVSTVPYVRVQHARTRQGPIERRFGIATLEVNSAGPDVRIEGLPTDVAERIKAFVLERAGNLVEPT